MEINGIPLHPLVVHAAVVLVPMAALAAALLVLPRWRWLARWPALLLAVAAAVSVQVAVLTGQDLRQDRGLTSALIESHEQWGVRLAFASWTLAVVTAVAFWSLPHVTRLVGGRDRQARLPVLEKPLLVAVPLLAVVVLVLVFLTGDAGARSVWGG